MRTSVATTKGFKVMRMIRRGHCLTCKPPVQDEIRFVNKLFDIFAGGLMDQLPDELRPE